MKKTILISVLIAVGVVGVMVWSNMIWATPPAPVPPDGWSTLTDVVERVDLVPEVSIVVQGCPQANNSEVSTSVQAEGALASPNDGNLAGGEGTPQTCDDYDPVEMDRRKWSYIIDQLLKRTAREELAARVEAWLVHRNSPAVGTGIIWAEAQERTGVSALLMVAIYDKESTCGTNGSLSRTNHNGWGMTGPHRDVPCENGFCWWVSWEEAVPGAFNFVSHVWSGAQTAYDCPGYATSSSWVEDVEYVRTKL